MSGERALRNELRRVARDMDVEAGHATNAALAAWFKQYASNLSVRADALTPTITALEAGRWP